MVIFDWFFAMLIFALIGAVVFGVALQGIGLLCILVGEHKPPTPASTLTIRTNHYDYDEDN